MDEPSTPPSGGNPFVPRDLDAMKPEHRQTYTLGLTDVRARLLALHSASHDGEALVEIVEEIEAALAALRALDDPRGHDAP